MVELRWRSRLSGDEAARVRAVLDAAAEADGLSPVSEAALLSISQPEGKDLHLLAWSGPAPDVPERPTHLPEPANTPAGGGQLVGYGHLDVKGGAGELVVLPGFRRRGVAGTMARAMVGHPAVQGRKLRMWAHGEHPAAKRLAERHGFTEVRALWQMGRSLLGPLDEPRLPDGARLRAFRPGEDESAVVEVNNRAFAWHPEQGGWTVRDVQLREEQPWFDPEGFLLAVDERAGRLLGFHWTKVHNERLGEVYVLGVDPAEHGRGIGRALTLAGLRHLKGRGMRSVMLYVEADNTAAIHTYQRLGFVHWGTDVAYSAPG